MALRYALLGLLNDGRASGYELTQRFSMGIDRYAWSATHSQIYPELKKLEAAGLVEVVEEGARGSRTYAITPAGQEELREWLLSPPSGKGARNEFALRLFMMSVLTADEATEMLSEIADYARAEISELSDKVDELSAEANSSKGTSIYAAQFGVYMHRAILEWTTWAGKNFTQ